MSVDAASGPSPAFYSYPSTLPSALTTPIAAPAPVTAPSASGSVSPYQSEFDTLQQDDAAELMNVSLGSAANAQSNIASVLAQAAALQGQQHAAQQQAALTDANAAVQSSSASSTSPATSVPTYESVVGASDSAATTNLGNYTSSGSSIDLLA